MSANPARGEATLTMGGEQLTLRPSFEALVAAEQELGPLFGLVERAAEGQLRLSELTALIWYCIHERPEHLARERVGQAVVEQGLARITPLLKTLLTQILQGRV